MADLGFHLWVLVAIAAALVALRWAKAGMLVWVLASWLAILFFLKLGFVTPVPGSVVRLYMGIATAAILAYVTSNAERLHATVDPLVRFIVEPRWRLALMAIVVLAPALVAFNVYKSRTVSLEAPSFARTIHPAPPDTITVHEQAIDLIRADNPYRQDKVTPEEFATHVENGRKIYYQNCFFCHGDRMAGDGMFVPALNPIPTNFTDKSTLGGLQASFVFWRVAKGGPGLPEEGGPWDSAMPAWERFLTVDEIWDVVLFIYEFNDIKPRAREEGHE